MHCFVTNGGDSLLLHCFLRQRPERPTGIPLWRFAAAQRNQFRLSFAITDRLKGEAFAEGDLVKLPLMLVPPTVAEDW